jgi:hypothetical protein
MPDRHAGCADTASARSSCAFGVPRAMGNGQAAANIAPGGPEQVAATTWGRGTA